MGRADQARSGGGILDRLRSVRTRITVAVVLLTGIALAGAGLAAYLVQLTRVDADITRNADQELEEFRTLQSEGIDPRTGESFTSAVRLLRVALQRNVPDENEALVAYWDGEPRRPLGATKFFQGTPREYDFTRDDAFADAIAAALPEGGSRLLETPVGTVLIAVQPVTDETTQGAYVVAFFVDRERAELLDTMRTYAYVAGGALALVTAGAWLTAGQLLRPVRDLRMAAQEISETDLTRRIEASGNDDLTDLTLTFNAMLDRLEDAFSTQRQFLDDAGHELRTPITIIRGHLELVDESDPREVAATKALVLDEIDRMSRLVDDLIVLAKSRRPGFLKPSPVEVGVLTDEVADKMRALGQRRWLVDARAEGAVELDQQRVTQALLQLASNAVRFTGPDDVVAVGSQVTPEFVRFWVRDSGIGIAPADRTRVFERFQRGSPPAGRAAQNGNAASDGSGLGLSIVSAIARAHGGWVSLESAPGEGSRFTLTVPRAADS